MPGWNHSNANWNSKKCAVCGKAFVPNSGVHKFCSAVCKGKWKYITGSVTTATQYKKISGSWPRYCSRLLMSKKRAAITRDDLLLLLEEQDYRCALTGVPLTCELEKGVPHPANASIDRIVAGGPYTMDNVQLVCVAVNKWRGNTPLEEFIEWCRLVVSHAEKEKSHAA